MRVRAIVGAWMVAASAAAAAQAQDSPWDVRLLPADPDWFYSEAADINNHGEIVGRFGANSDADSRGILWTGASWVDLGDYCGQPEGWLLSQARGITDRGLVVGVLYTGTGDSLGVIWDIRSRTYQVVDPEPGQRTPSPVDINESGMAVGYLYGDTPVGSRAFAWNYDAGAGRLLPLPPGAVDSYAYKVAEDGTVAGSAGFFQDPATSVSHAIVWKPDGSILDLHPEVVAAIPDVQGTTGEGIDGNGDIYGWAHNAVWWPYATRFYAWRWSANGGVTQLSTFERPATFIFLVDGRFVGGGVGQLQPGTFRAIVWLDGLAHLLPDLPGFGNMFCQGANEAGNIVGVAVNPGGMWWWSGSRAFIAEPRAEGDFDGDALQDRWELQGYVHDNGAQVDLPGMGANPLRKDLFVQIDGMGPSPWDHLPTIETMQPVVDAFAGHGIALHVDIDERLEFQEILGSWDGPTKYRWEEFDAIKADHFAPELGAAVRYGVFAHRLGVDKDDSGVARGYPGCDFLVSLGAFAEEAGSIDPWWQAGTFMHELGHLLGLQHGGSNVTNRKPNYLSVMNYDFQKQGLRIGGQDGHFDYSGLKLADLDESALLESVGLGSDPAIAGYRTLYRRLVWDAELQNVVAQPFWSGDVTGPIDWNGSGTIEAGAVFGDVNGDGSVEVLKGHDDWSSLDFAGGTVGFGVGLPVPVQPPVTDSPPELTVDEAKQIRPPPVEGLAARAGRGMVRLSWTPVGPYGQATYTVYRWQGEDAPEEIAQTEASLISDRVGSGTWKYMVTVTDSLGVESEDSATLTVGVR